MKCKLCIERGRPANFGSEPQCAFTNGVFDSHNWNCATAVEIRKLMGEGWDTLPSEERLYTRRHDRSFGALWVSPHPEDVPDGDEVGVFRGGGFIAGHWYKHQGRTDMLIRVDPRNGGRTEESGQKLTLEEAEAVLENCRSVSALEKTTTAV